MVHHDVQLPDTLNVQDVRDMSKKDLANAMKNINDAHEELLEHFGEYFQPKAENFFHNWLKSGLGFSAGRRLQAEI